MNISIHKVFGIIVAILIVIGVGNYAINRGGTTVNHTQAPDLDRIIVSDALPESQRENIISNIKKITNTIRNGNVQITHWFDLASYRKLGGDYEGARNVWNYILSLEPSNFSAFLDLANLYNFYDKNPKLAEEYYRKSIDVNPTYVPTYLEFHELYRYNYPEKENLADDILLEGLDATGDKLAFLVPLGEYYESISDKDNALKYYNNALDEAKLKFDSNQQQRIQENIDRLMHNN